MLYYKNFREFYTESEADEWARYNFNQWIDRINDNINFNTNNIATLLYLYTGSLNIIYNRFLNGLFSFSENDLEEHTRNITSIVEEINKHELPENIIVYRYTRKIWIEEMIKTSNLENSFTDRGFVSTTLVPGLLREFAQKHRYDCIMRIYLPKGTKGVYINFYNSILNEHEVLLPPNLTFRLIKKYIILSIQRFMNVH